MDFLRDVKCSSNGCKEHLSIQYRTEQKRRAERRFSIATSASCLVAQHHWDEVSWAIRRLMKLMRLVPI